VRGKEEHNLPLLVLDGDDVEEAPERRSCNTNKSIEKQQLKLKSIHSMNPATSHIMQTTFLKEKTRASIFEFPTGISLI
jgi:hypothetical protein